MSLSDALVLFYIPMICFFIGWGIKNFLKRQAEARMDIYERVERSSVEMALRHGMASFVIYPYGANQQILTEKGQPVPVYIVCDPLDAAVKAYCAGLESYRMNAVVAGASIKVLHGKLDESVLMKSYQQGLFNGLPFALPGNVN